MKNKKLWFRAKRWGWGWYPISWQGWVVTIIYTLILLGIATNTNPKASLGAFYMHFAPPFVVITIILLAICYTKGERPKWRWGGK